MGRMMDAPASSVTFTPPSGLELDGDSGEALVKWKRTADNQIAIESINGVSLGGGDAENADEDAASNEEDDSEAY